MQVASTKLGFFLFVKTRKSYTVVFMQYKKNLKGRTALKDVLRTQPAHRPACMWGQSSQSPVVRNLLLESFHQRVPQLQPKAPTMEPTYPSLNSRASARIQVSSLPKRNLK